MVGRGWGGGVSQTHEKKSECWSLFHVPPPPCLVVAFVLLTVPSLHIRSVLFLIQESLDNSETELLPVMGAMKVWWMGDKVSDVSETVKLRGDSGWKDSSGVEEIWIWLW